MVILFNLKGRTELINYRELNQILYKLNERSPTKSNFSVLWEKLNLYLIIGEEYTIDQL